MKPISAFLVTLSLLLASCASGPPAPRPPQPLLTAADHGKTVHLIIGETVDLQLASNPTTGYSWTSLRLPEWKVVKQTRHAYQGPDNTGPGQALVGASGKEHWQFLAVAEGRTGIDLVYRRAWEEPQETDQKLTIEFVVTKDGKEMREE
ncbi:MAG: protease inhibitor I42 family protein [Verrucomicrobiaceae bacterium]|jgi:predicted secreted protein|nr:protease inhibitor I42 family protein [Verrucomicrobiaceae bacterium]